MSTLRDDVVKKSLKTAEYYRNLEDSVSNHSRVISNKIQQISEATVGEMSQKDIESLHKSRRRHALAQLLHEESLKFHEELAKKQFPQRSVETMKARISQLRNAKEQRRLEFVDEKLYKQFLENNSSFKEERSKVIQKRVTEDWAQQIEMKKEKERQEQEWKIREKEMFEKQAEEAIMKAEEEEKVRLAKQLEFKQSIEQQIDQLRFKNQKCKQLEEDEHNLITQRKMIEEIEEMKRMRDNRAKNVELGETLKAQHIAKIRARSRQVQEDLDYDQKLMEMLIKTEKENSVKAAEKRDKARADAEWMIRVFKDQRKLEMAREKELELIHSHEAMRAWHDREANWVREQKARENLMNEVLNERSAQIEYKLRKIREEKQEEEMERTTLIEKLEEFELTERIEKENSQRKNHEMSLDLQKQIEEKRGRTTKQQTTTTVDDPEMTKRMKEDVNKQEMFYGRKKAYYG